MKNIYDQHRASFSQVSGYAVLKDGVPVAKIAFKFPKDGAGRLYAYVHYIGTEMQRGHANGGGYDKKSAAVEVAVNKISKQPWSSCLSERAPHRKDFENALVNIGGNSWEGALRDAGFTVFNTI